VSRDKDRSQGCATTRCWRAQAQHLRDNAYLTETGRWTLGCEVKAVDRLADRWLDAALEE
jgi:hypothetical protein